jgi:hypothetical protein
VFAVLGTDLGTEQREIDVTKRNVVKQTAERR